MLQIGKKIFFFFKWSFELYIENYPTKRITCILADLLHKVVPKKTSILQISCRLLDRKSSQWHFVLLIFAWLVTYLHLSSTSFRLSGVSALKKILSFRWSHIFHKTTWQTVAAQSKICFYWSVLGPRIRSCLKKGT